MGVERHYRDLDEETVLNLAEPFPLINCASQQLHLNPKPLTLNPKP